MHGADPVFDRGSVKTARPLRRTPPGGDNDRFPFSRKQHMPDGLRPWPLCDEEQLAARKIFIWLGQRKDHLERENDIAVDVLVKAIIVSGAVFQHERRRAGLAVCVAIFEKVFVVFGVPARKLERVAQFPRRWRSLRQ